MVHGEGKVGKVGNGHFDNMSRLKVEEKHCLNHMGSRPMGNGWEAGKPGHISGGETRNRANGGGLIGLRNALLAGKKEH